MKSWKPEGCFKEGLICWLGGRGCSCSSRHSMKQLPTQIFWIIGCSGAEALAVCGLCCPHTWYISFLLFLLTGGWGYEVKKLPIAKGDLDGAFTPEPMGNIGLLPFVGLWILTTVSTQSHKLLRGSCKREISTDDSGPFHSFMTVLLRLQAGIIKGL